MRSFAILLLLVFAAMPALALDTSQIAWYVHGDLALPTGDFGDVAGTGFGGGIGGAMPYSESLTLRGEAGYIYFGGESYMDSEYNYSLIPIMVLGEYQFEPGSPLYGLGGIGLGMAMFSWEWDFLGQHYDESDSDTDLMIAVGGGYRLGPQMAVEARYNIGDLDHLGVHFLYNF